MTTAALFDYRGAREAIFASALPGALKLLALALVEFMPVCRPSVLTLAGNCGVERKTVLRALGRLERLGVLVVERAAGQRSRYHLQPPHAWRVALVTQDRTGTPRGPVPDSGTGDTTGPVPLGSTGVTPEPVPTSTGTGTNGGPGPVPTAAPTSPIAGGPEAVLSGPNKLSEAVRALTGAGFVVTGAARALTMPGPDPSSSYLASCVMAGVAPIQAQSTWAHYWTQGLPPQGVEKLEPWLVQQAVDFQTRAAKVPTARGAPARPGDDLTTTAAATAFRPNWEHRAFVNAQLPSHDLDLLAQKCRLVPRFAALDTAAQEREFMARLRCLKATGMFFHDGPLPRKNKEREPSP